MADSPEQPTPPDSSEQPAPPQAPVPDAQPPQGPGNGGAAKKKGLSPLAWVLIVVGVILALMLGSCVACGVVATRMARQVAEDFEDNPAKAAAELAVRMNPDLEIVESDDEEGTLTIRNARTGEEGTFDFSEIAEGGFSFSTAEGESSLRMEEGGMTATGPDGRVTTFGAGSAADLPDWAILYPGADIQGVGSTVAADGETTGAFQMTSSDAPEVVVDRLQELLEEAGYEVTLAGSAGTTTLTGRQADSERTLTYFVQGGASGSMITAQYTDRG